MDILRIIKEELYKESRAVSNVITKDENYNELLEYLYNTYSFENVYVSFRKSVNVTKINPLNKYNTPTGLYTYKLSNYTDKVPNNIKEFRKLFPYMNELNYIHFYIPNDNVNIVSSDTEKSKLDKHVIKLKKLYGNKIEPISNLCDNWLDDSYSSYYSEAKHPTHKFWLFLYDVSSYIAKDKSAVKNTVPRIAREIGIHGFDDNKCEGWIHPSEKCQTVFFKSNIFKDHYVLQDKYNNIGVNTHLDIQQGKRITLKDNTPKESIIKLINKNQLIRVTNKNILLSKDYIINDPKLFKLIISYLTIDDVFEVFSNQNDDVVNIIINDYMHIIKPKFERIAANPSLLFDVVNHIVTLVHENKNPNTIKILVNMLKDVIPPYQSKDVIDTILNNIPSYNMTTFDNVISLFSIDYFSSNPLKLNHQATTTFNNLLFEKYNIAQSIYFPQLINYFGFTKIIESFLFWVFKKNNNSIFDTSNPNVIPFIKLLKSKGDDFINETINELLNYSPEQEEFVKHLKKIL